MGIKAALVNGYLLGSVVEFSQLNEDTVSGLRMDECFLPIGLRIVEAEDAESEVRCAVGGGPDIRDLERQVVKAFTPPCEEDVDEVCLICRIDCRYQLELAAWQEILGPVKVAAVVESGLIEGASHQGHQRTRCIDVFNRDGDVIETFDQIAERRCEVDLFGCQGVAIRRSYHWSTSDSDTVSIRYKAARIMKPAKNWNDRPVHSLVN